MKKKYNKLTCLFGHHNYSKRLVILDARAIYLCKICKRHGYRKLGGGKVWNAFDKDGQCIYMKFSTGEEYWWDKNGGRWSRKHEKQI